MKYLLIMLLLFAFAPTGHCNEVVIYARTPYRPVVKKMRPDMPKRMRPVRIVPMSPARPVKGKKRKR